MTASRRLLLTMTPFLLLYACVARRDFFQVDDEVADGASGAGNDEMGGMSSTEKPPKACSAGEWSESGVTPCERWTTCAAGQFIDQMGTTTSDQKCSSCKTGFTDEVDQDECTAWQVCGPIWEMNQEGTASTDRTCQLPTPYLASVSTQGVLANEATQNPSISDDGRYVVFDSQATNLVASDTNDASDVFLHDTRTGETTRISVNDDGVEANGDSDTPTISSDGRFIAFDSRATNLVPGDTNASWDIFVHDRDTGKTIRVSVASAGTQGETGSKAGIVSGGGNCVAFSSYSNNLVPDDNNDEGDIFVHQIDSGITTRVTVSSSGVESNGYTTFYDISADCRNVVFSSFATNLVQDDTNETADVFLHNLETGATTRASVSGSGIEGNDYSNYPSISPDGRFVAFNSAATNLVVGDTNAASDVFIRDTLEKTTILASSTAADALRNAGSKYVVFESAASNITTSGTGDKMKIFVTMVP